MGYAVPAKEKKTSCQCFLGIFAMKSFAFLGHVIGKKTVECLCLYLTTDNAYELKAEKGDLSIYDNSVDQPVFTCIRLTTTIRQFRLTNVYSLGDTLKNGESMQIHLQEITRTLDS